MHGDMRLNDGKVEEEWLLRRGLIRDEFLRLRDHQFRGIAFAQKGIGRHHVGGFAGMARDGLRVDFHLLIVAPEKARIIGMRDRLTIVAEEQIEALPVRITGAAHGADAANE